MPDIDAGLVKKAYRDGEINARQYHQALYQLSRQTFEERVMYSGGAIGAVKAVMGQIWDDLKTRYDEIQQSAKSDKTMQAALDEMKKTGKMPEMLFTTPEGLGERIWKDVQAAMSPASRTAELSGIGWKHTASALGAPPWMAKLIGYAAETNASFVLTG